MDTECIFGKMGISMRGNGKLVWDMAMGLIFSIMEISILDNIATETLTALDNTSGRMGINTQGCLEMGKSMGKVNGRKIYRMVNLYNSLKVNIEMIRRMDMVSSNGWVVINTEASIWMI